MIPFALMTMRIIKMKLLTLLLFSMVLIVGCVPGPQDRNFIRYMDTLTQLQKAKFHIIDFQDTLQK